MRFAVALVGFVAAVIFPPWVPAICIVILALRYRAWEAIVLGLLIDLTWQPAGSVFHVIPLFTISCIFALWAFEPVRSQFLQ